jgi:hypothetical protein
MICTSASQMEIDFLSGRAAVPTTAAADRVYFRF